MARKPATEQMTGEEAKLPPPVSGEAASSEGTKAAEDGPPPSDDAQAAPAAAVTRLAEKAEKAQATVISAIEHDGQAYGPGDPIDLTRAEFAALVKAGAVQDEDWDELPIPF